LAFAYSWLRPVSGSLSLGLDEASSPPTRELINEHLRPVEAIDASLRRANEVNHAE
jgi:hypothetical protein